jgi:phosphoglucomutase
MQLRLVGARIDLRKQIAGANVLTLLESDGLHLAIDPDADRHGVVGLNVPIPTR